VHQIELEMQNQELRRTHNELEISRARYFDLYDLAPVGYLTLSGQGLIQEANLAAATMLGVKRSALVKRPISQVILKEDQDTYYLHRRELLKTGEPRACELRMVKDDGKVFWASLEARANQDTATNSEQPPEGELVIYVVLSDITERKRAEDRINEYAQRLIEMEEDLRKSIARDLHDDVAQELTALGLNLVYASNHLTCDPENSLSSILEDSRTLTKAVSRSVRDLMVELYPLQLEEYGLPDAIRLHAEQFTNRIGIEVTVNNDPQIPRLTRKDETAIFRIVQEAMSNIMKHAAATKVTISLNKVGEFVQLTITDDGKGFVLQEALPQLGGSGWGLTNMRERARLIGGVLCVNSNLGQGTSITLEVKGVKA
jgi:PAS domain S-box-containing protein